MDPISLVIIISAVILSFTILVKLNWQAFRPLGNWITPAKLLGILRLIEGMSTFVIATIIIVADTFLKDSIFAMIISCIIGVTSTKRQLGRKI